MNSPPKLEQQWPVSTEVILTPRTVKLDSLSYGCEGGWVTGWMGGGVMGCEGGWVG